MSARLHGPAMPAVRHATLSAMLEAAAATTLGLTFVDAMERETRLPYRALRDRARRVASALIARGVAPGDRVAMVLPTGPGFMDAFFGALCAGAVPVPLYPPLRLGRLEEYHPRTARMMAISGAKLLITDGRIRLLLGKSLAAFPPALGCAQIDALLAEAQGEREVPTSPDALALIQFSSGTTVDAKPVALTHANLLATVAAIDALMPAPPQTTQGGVSWLPLYHDMGLIGCLLVALYHPGPLCLIPPEVFLAHPAIWLRAIGRHRALVSAAPNFAYGLCAKRIVDHELVGVDLSSWKLALNGAEPVSPATLRAFTDRFASHGLHPHALTPVYGLSEAALAVTFSRVDAPFQTTGVDGAHLARSGEVRDGDREVVSVGAPVAGVAIEVRDDAGGVVEVGQVGHVFVRGPGVMRGYHDAPEATGAVLKDGWLDTGDRGFVHQGALFLAGRRKELVIVRGANHAPQVFEEALEGLAGVRAGCAVAFGWVPPGESDEALALLVERAQTGPHDAALIPQIRARVAERTGIAPHTVLMLAPGTLPRTSSGKLRRREAARQHAQGTLSPPAPVHALRIGAAMIEGEIAHLLTRFRR